MHRGGTIDIKCGTRSQPVTPSLTIREMFWYETAAVGVVSRSWESTVHPAALQKKARRRQPSPLEQWLLCSESRVLQATAATSARVPGVVRVIVGGGRGQILSTHVDQPAGPSATSIRSFGVWDSVRAGHVQQPKAKWKPPARPTTTSSRRRLAHHKFRGGRGRTHRCATFWGPGPLGPANNHIEEGAIAALLLCCLSRPARRCPRLRQRARTERGARCCV